MKYFLIVLFLIGCEGKDYSNKKSDATFDIICINNHSYYRDTVGYGGYLAIKLNDDGTPFKCGGGE